MFTPKVIIVDACRPGQRVLIGSQNFSVASLDYNRELGILSRNGAIVAAVSATLARDYSGGRPFRGKASGARCTATATVYNASYDENNVYVYSNQPYATATAMADGYSYSWETNGSGVCTDLPQRPAPLRLITVTTVPSTAPPAIDVRICRAKTRVDRRRRAACEGRQTYRGGRAKVAQVRRGTGGSWVPRN